MKRQCLFWWLWVVLVGCHPETKAPEIGVSLELAHMRKQCISDVRYELKFCIPDNLQEKVCGNVKVRMKLDEIHEVVLDFREGAEQVRTVTVNGHPEMVQWVNEHIVVADTYLKLGENEIEVDFVAGNQSLNRNEEFLYTLLVPERARTLFPCFDQPDMKARFSLRLEVPVQWDAVANAPLLTTEQGTDENRKVLVFAETHPLSTYLFSFVAGKWQQIEETRNGQTVRMYYRETDPQKVAQHPLIFDQVFAAIEWMENYTGIPYPFAKYDLVIVPGFLFGGMEHPGAVLYNDKRMFLGPHPTMEEELGRQELIAHETAHMWFGDAVTMAWFDDVWTKEVFANYFAARMTVDGAVQLSQDGEGVNDLRNFYIPAYSEDRTAGSTAIKQPLDNLKDAGLIYGQIVYEKAPIVMKMLVERLGEEAFQQGIREYLKTYLYGNATWEELILILDKYTSDDLVAWSRTWVNEKGMPDISASWAKNKLTICQEDPWKRGLVWPQQIDVVLYAKEQTTAATSRELLSGLLLDSAVCIFESTQEYADEPYILVNVFGKAYGYTVLNSSSSSFVLQHLRKVAKTPEERLALLIHLNENRLHGRVKGEDFVRTLLSNLQEEEHPLIVSTSIAYLKEMALHGELAGSPEIEQGLLDLSRQSGRKECQQAAFRALLDVFRQPSTVQEIYRIWEGQRPYSGLLLGESDYMKMAYELSIRMPEKYDTLKAIQFGRIDDPDRQREFQFVVRAVAPETVSRDSLFQSLLIPENRRIEPWVVQILGYLNHSLRQQDALKYVLPALQELQEVQRTGDIFFPKNWIEAVLRGHNSEEAAEIVRQFLAQNPDYPVLLKNKILQSADHLLRFFSQETF